MPATLSTYTIGHRPKHRICGSGLNGSPLRKVAAVADVIITIVGFPVDVESVYLGEDVLCIGGTIRKLGDRHDHFLSQPGLTHRPGGRGQGDRSFGCPARGDIGAREARLSIMGGSVSGFERALPLFEIMGKNIVHQGPVGSGQQNKMGNQIAIASGMMAISEAMAYAKKSGLQPETVLKSIESGAAGSWSLTNLAPRVLKGDYAPGFFVKHFIKDMKITLSLPRPWGSIFPLQLAKSFMTSWLLKDARTMAPKLYSNSL